MKRIISLTALLAVIMTLTSCASAENSSDPLSSYNSSQSVSDAVSDNSEDSVESSGDEDGTDSFSEPQKPAGEATFLTLPDGTPIYTSQITKYQKQAEFHGTHEQYALDTFNRETFTDNFMDAEAVCEGFAYVYTPHPTISFAEHPEKFTESGGIREYIGEEIPPEKKYFRINVGDKIGDLTVKSAQTRFSNYEASMYNGDPDDVPGIYLTGADIQYDGELEMTGYISVRETKGYDTAGDLYFTPIGECASLIPLAEYKFRSDISPMGVYHETFQFESAYGDLDTIGLGNMYDYDNIDFAGLKPGDDQVLVKLTLKDPNAGFA